MELAIGPDASGRLAAGMRRRQSHEIVPLSQCAIAGEEASAIAREFSRLLNSREWPENFWRFLVLRRDHGPEVERWRAIAISRPPSRQELGQSRRLAQAMLDACPGLFAFIHESRRDRAPIAKGEKRVFAQGRPGEEAGDLATLRMRLGGRAFEADAGAFFQVNDGAAELLAARAVESARPGGGAMLDLFCGVGAPGLLLAPGPSRYLGVELDPSAVASARRNARDMPHCSFMAMGAEAALAKLPPGFADDLSTVLIDPPRAGMGKRAMDSLAALAPENVIMISCEPATFARDAKRLAASHRLASLGAVDMFPHSPHVEAWSLWTRQ